jgi:hypothetical protein
MNSDHTRGAKRRSVLLTVAALGAFVCLVGGAVLYSALQDTARTGTNSVESGALAGSADIQLATATRTGDTITCGAFSDDLASPLFTLTSVSPGFGSSTEYFCIKNVGSQSVTLSALAEELADIDVDCTGDELLHGDTTCGANQLGELSSVLTARYFQYDCQPAVVTGGGNVPLNGNATTPVALGSLAASATACLAAEVVYLSSTATAAVQTAQSDRTTWRYKFTAQA